VPHLAEDRRDRDLRFRRQEEEAAAGLELAKFGMDDVDRTLGNSMSRLKEEWRHDLDKLTGEYLREVLRGDYESVDIAHLRDLDEVTLTTMLDRISEATLPASDKRNLHEMVAKINKEGEIEAQDRVVVHFLAKLQRLYSEQANREKQVRALVEVCNVYLQGKEFIFDSNQFTLRIVPRQSDFGSLLPMPMQDGPLKLRMLSSGEKQIVSLFTQLYLSLSPRLFIIIDEPEQSLSVIWQKRFLPDIVKSGHCTNLVAVTHSPFIYDNDLDRYAHSLSEFVEVNAR
jgi:predicted ATP-dependent endonuclease of OLD family